jgi:hypothetical protein
MAIYSQLYNRDWDRGKQKISVFMEETVGGLFTYMISFQGHVYSNTKYMVVMQWFMHIIHYSIFEYAVDSIILSRG